MNTSERRVEKRTPFQAPVEVYPVFPNMPVNGESRAAGSLLGSLRDLSEKGAGLSAEKEFKPGSVLKLRFEFVTSHWVEIFGKVAWSREYQAGLEFFADEGLFPDMLRDFLGSDLKPSEFPSKS